MQVFLTFLLLSRLLFLSFYEFKMKVFLISLYTSVNEVINVLTQIKVYLIVMGTNLYYCFYSVHINKETSVKLIDNVGASLPLVSPERKESMKK